MNGMTQKTCKECGTIFFTYDKRRKYCPPIGLEKESRCKSRAVMKRHFDRKRGGPPSCRVCGKPFEVRRSGQKYCPSPLGRWGRSECAVKAAKMREDAKCTQN